MLFSSPVFFAFFAVFLVVYRFVPDRWRLGAIIVGSAVFYAWWRVEYLTVPVVLTVIGYFGALHVVAAATPTDRRRRLLLVVVVLFLPLVAFKYTDFFIHQVFGPVVGGSVSRLDLILPLGISFITFTIAAYVIDVYRGHYPAEASFSRLLGYVLFFPHLIAGPILRPRELLPQLARLKALASRRLTLAAALFTVGLAKKLIVADQIAPAVDAVYAGQGTLTGWYYLLAVYGFSVQIYCDFSGYTDMAIGLALALGIKLPNNFSRPYSSASIIEFWRRWHITLSYWLRDYLYIAMGGNRNGKAQQMRNLVVTMVLGGLWHGANWTFVLWGLVHGLGIAALHLVRGFARLAWPKWLAVLLTFHFVTAAWVLFRAPDLSTAWRVAHGSMMGPWTGADAFFHGHLFVLLLLVIFAATHRFDSHARVRFGVRRYSRPLVWLAIAMVWVMAIAVSHGSSANFIYFDF
jgi:alginate O-acetyltransferase complex protein AlgI